jgi:hypothetical protein
MSPAKVIEKSRPSGPTLANQEKIDHDHHNCCPPQLFLRMAIATAEASTPNLVAISAIGTHLSAQTTTNLGSCLRYPPPLTLRFDLPLTHTQFTAHPPHDLFNRFLPLFRINLANTASGGINASYHDRDLP